MMQLFILQKAKICHDAVFKVTQHPTKRIRGNLLRDTPSVSEEERPCLTLAGFEPVIPLKRGLWNPNLGSFLPEDKSRFSCSPWITTTAWTAVQCEFPATQAMPASVHPISKKWLVQLCGHPGHHPLLLVLPGWTLRLGARTCTGGGCCLLSAASRSTAYAWAGVLWHPMGKWSVFPCLSLARKKKNILLHATHAGKYLLIHKMQCVYVHRQAQTSPVPIPDL